MSLLARKRNLFLATLKADFSASGSTSDLYRSMISAVQVPFLCCWAIDWYTSFNFPSATSSGERVATTSAESCLVGFDELGDCVCGAGFCSGASGLTPSSGPVKISASVLEAIGRKRYICDETIASD